MRVTTQADAFSDDRRVIIRRKFHWRHVDALSQPKQSHVNASVGVDDIKRSYCRRPRVTGRSVDVERLRCSRTRPSAAFAPDSFQSFDYLSINRRKCLRTDCDPAAGSSCIRPTSHAACRTY